MRPGKPKYHLLQALAGLIVSRIPNQPETSTIREKRIGFLGKFFERGQHMISGEWHYRLALSLDKVNGNPNLLWGILMFLNQ